MWGLLHGCMGCYMDAWVATWMQGLLHGCMSCYMDAWVAKWCMGFSRDAGFGTWKHGLLHGWVTTWMWGLLYVCSGCYMYAVVATRMGCYMDPGDATLMVATWKQGLLDDGLLYGCRG
jgi:hypothetical protein